MQSTWQHLDKLNTLDNMSGIGMLSQNSPMATKSDMNKRSGRTIAERKPTKLKATKGPLDDLNNWMYCDPERTSDVLPQPFRFINEVIEEVLMQRVNQKIDEINELKNNPSYEGHVSKAQPSGAYEFEGITCFSQEENSLGYVLAGDSTGSIYLLDIANKARLTKFDTKTGKSVLQISMHTFKYGDRHAILFFVVHIGQYEVDCYLMFSHELITVKKVFSFGVDAKKLAEQAVTKEKKPAAAAPVKKGLEKDGKKAEEEHVPQIEYLDQYPFVG